MATLKKNTEVTSNNEWRERLIAKQKAIGYNTVNNVYNDIIETPQVSNLLTSHLLTKIGRAKLLINRRTSDMQRAIPDNNDVGKNKTPEYTQYTHQDANPVTDSRNRSTSPKSEPSTNNVETITLKKSKENTTTRETVKHSSLKKETVSTIKNKIVILNSSVSPYIAITIQGMPNELEINPEPTWATVKSMGRNNPFYMYTGSEDTISFDISWFAVDKNREDVINKCRLLESWSKANGYNTSPPNLDILWGNSDIFSGQKFILYSAKYVLGNFQNSYRAGSRDKGEVVDLKLYPNSAVQSLVFKRVTSGNLTHDEIISPNKLDATTGIDKKNPQ